MNFDENTSSLIFLKPSYGLSNNDPFGIVEDIGSAIPPMLVSTNSWTAIPELIGSQRTLIKIITSPD